MDGEGGDRYSLSIIHCQLSTDSSDNIDFRD